MGQNKAFDLVFCLLEFGYSIWAFFQSLAPSPTFIKMQEMVLITLVVILCAIVHDLWRYHIDP